MTVEALLSLGSNMGDRKALVDDAVSRLAALPDTTLRARSSYYRTEPVGPVKQEWFLNIAVALRTARTRGELLAACHAIESDLGRDRTKEIFWGPRPIDIDVVVYGEASEIDERAFVIVPLAEIAPTLPVGEHSLADHAGRIGADGVEKLAWAVPRV